MSEKFLWANLARRLVAEIEAENMTEQQAVRRDSAARDGKPTQQYAREVVYMPTGRKILIVACWAFWIAVATVLVAFAIEAGRKWLSEPVAVPRIVSYMPASFMQTDATSITYGLECKNGPD